MIVTKILQKLEVVLIKQISYFNVRYYMKLYVNWLRKSGVDIPTYNNKSYIHPSTNFDGSCYNFIHIGQNVTISRDVLILVHDYSIYRAIEAVKGIENHEIRYRFMKPITIGDGCFIGANVIILPGTTIGSNTIIGAGAVIKGNVNAEKIVAGNPAKEIANISDFVERHLSLKDFETYRSK